MQNDIGEDSVENPDCLAELGFWFIAKRQGIVDTNMMTGAYIW